MKKKLIMMFLGVFLLCGCEAKSETKFTINEDKSMDIEMIVGYDNELIDAVMNSMQQFPEGSDGILDNEQDAPLEDNLETKEYTDEERRLFLNEGNMTIGDYTVEEIKEKGFDFQEYKDEIYMGYIITKRIDNIDNLVGTPDFNLNNIADIDSKKIFTKEKGIYRGRILFNDTSNNDYADNEGLSELNIIYNFILRLPNKPISNNATTVSEDGRMLIWNLVSGTESTIDFEFEYPSAVSFIKNNMFIVAGIAVVVVLLIVLVITLLLKRANAKNNNLDNVIKQNKVEPVMEKNNNINTVEQNQINQVSDVNAQNKVQEQEQVNNLHSSVLESNPTQTNSLETQIIQPQVMQSQTMIQNQQYQNVQQPIQNVQTQSIPMQPQVNTLNENQIPQIKPIIPVHINEQPIVNQGMQFVQQPNMIPTQQTNTMINQTVVNNQDNAQPTLQNNINK